MANFYGNIDVDRTIITFSLNFLSIDCEDIFMKDNYT